MTNRISKIVFAALLLVFLTPVAALAQVTYWVQIEAHATLRTAEEFARRYQERIGNIAGFRIVGGWYALAAGPYATAEEAEARLSELLAAREIRSDAYVSENRVYGHQFWPVGGQAASPPPLTVQPAPQVDAEAAGAVSDGPDTVVEVAVDAVTETEADSVTEAAAEAVSTETAPMAEPEPMPEPIPVAETLDDARSFEFSLNRQDRMAIQTALQWFGYYRLGIDAQFGPGTRGAIRDWQTDQGLEPWGFLGRGQMATLLTAYDDAVARYGFGPFRDEAAGIEMTLPLGMVAFERHEAPFAYFREINDSGIRVMLISQAGSQSTLSDLYDTLQTLELIPLGGARDRGRDRFTITGQNAVRRAHVEARLQNGSIKGWMLLWDAPADDDAELITSTLRESFRAFGGALPPTMGATASSAARRGLIGGLDVRRPERSRSGFFVDAMGTVVTSAEAVQGCGRVTIDETYGASVRLIDANLGIAVLTPQDPLVPLAFAQFSRQAPRANSAVSVSAFSDQDRLTRPVLSTGEISALQGPGGEPYLSRLSLNDAPGASGGPVFDNNGAVIGMMLARPQMADGTAPADEQIAVNSAAILSTLQGAGLSGTQSRISIPMSAAILSRVTADLTVLVSCWN